MYIVINETIKREDKRDCLERILESLRSVSGIPDNTRINFRPSTVVDLQGNKVACADVIPDEGDFNPGTGELIINDIMRTLEHGYHLETRRHPDTTSFGSD